ncbi:GH1 family beta-glucosidase [Archangium primigenium]|uniref:GH1 family beta-glucosidase n=1 Tax=[Archangium] primigenium TaxID=2792470 RepID=UPI001958EF54|nr:GH1 family beta-glucosidase [Archangium primigenium]MBM7118088.1 beta-glucosidase [Archangium primigenium]
MTTVHFPKGFLWGTATSSYQIEGAAQEDGRGESIWDRFSKTPGKVEDGTNGDVACDHYHRYRDDVALMKRLGMQAYRFSVAWPRVLPTGRGRVNPAGLDFYKRLVDALLEAGIEPFVTLYHWDLPQVLQDEGGWTQRSTAEAFTEYADVVARALGDRVKNWITHNEPWCTSLLSHEKGIHAPGLKDFRAALLASHHVLLSHGWAVPVIRAASPGAQVGITLNFSPAEAASPSAADYDAFRHYDGYFNRWFLDPLYGRHYPADMVADYVRAGHLPPEGLATLVRPGDLEAIAAPCDFLGVNYYNRAVIRSDRVPESENLPRTVHLAPPSEWTEMGWEVHADSLRRILTRLHLVYAPARLYVTENGASFSVGPDAEGRVRDDRRLAYLREHFLAARKAMEAGAPLAGYFVWSFLDNFEWDRGYSQRFGIVWVDYKTQQRIPKDSALWYRDVIAANAVEG